MRILHRFCIITLKLFFTAIRFLALQYKKRGHHDIAQISGTSEYCDINEVALIAKTEYVDILAEMA